MQDEEEGADEDQRESWGIASKVKAIREEGIKLAEEVEHKLKSMSLVEDTRTSPKKMRKHNAANPKKRKKSKVGTSSLKEANKVAREARHVR